MAEAPLILYLAVLAQILPLIAWLAARQRTRPGGLIVLGGLIGLLGDAAGRLLAAHWRNNHVATYLDAPLITICFLAAFREWQVSARERRWMGIAAVVFLVACVGLVASIEDIGTFNFGVGPLSSLMLLGAGLWTLLRRAGVIEQTPLYQSDWFWGALGFAVYGAATALASPIAGLFLDRQRVDLIVITWEVRAVFVLAAWFMIAWGLYRGPATSRFVIPE